MSPMREASRVPWTRVGMLAALLTLAVTVAILLAGIAGAPPTSAQSAESTLSSGLTGFIGLYDADGELLIKGESTDAEHKDWIDLISFNQGVVVPQTTGGAAGARSGGATFSDVTFVKVVDRSSPRLQEAAVMGTVIPLAVIEVVKDGSPRQTYLRYELSDVRVTSYNVGSTGQKNVSDDGQPRVEVGGPGLSERPYDEVAFAFSKILFQYRPQNPDGSLGDWIEFSWDLKRNQP